MNIEVFEQSNNRDLKEDLNKFGKEHKIVDIKTHVVPDGENKRKYIAFVVYK